MTIAAGFVCDDAIVLCADTQYSNATAKVFATKLWQSQNGDCVIAASGDEVLMKETAETILSRFESGMELDEVKEIVENTLEAIYTQHVDKYIDPNYTVHLLVAAKVTSGLVLFKHSRWAVTTVDLVSCIGTGEIFGNYVAERFWPERGPLIAGCIVAAHLVQLVKKYDVWVGGQTEIIVLPAIGHAYPQSKRNIANVEQFFDSVDAVLRPLLLVIPDSRYSSDVVEDRLQRFCEGIRATRPFPFDITVAVTGVGALGLAGTISTVVIGPAPKPPAEDS